MLACSTLEQQHQVAVGMQMDQSSTTKFFDNPLS